MATFTQRRTSYFNVPQTGALILSKSNPLEFRKELIYVGKFGKRTATENYDFEVTPETLQHWHNTFLAMSANGVDVPLTVEHTNDPTKTGGKVVKLSVEKNEKGVDALFATVEFADAERAKMAKTANVSLFSPAQFTDGKLNQYYYPITHVALTDHPVIPGLEPFQAISLSLMDTNMNPLREIAKQLGIADTVPDAELQNAIKAAIDKLDKQPEPDADDKGPKPPVAASATPPVVTPVAASNVPAAVAPPAAVLSMVTDARNTKIDALVLSGRITTAVATGLKSEFCSPNAISLAFANKPDSFDATIKALGLNEPVISYKEQTGNQTHENISLSQNLDAKQNPMLAEAQRRAEAAKTRR